MIPVISAKIKPPPYPETPGYQTRPDTGELVGQNTPTEKGRFSLLVVAKCTPARMLSIKGIPWR